jgi:hypothetical protein
VASNPYLAFDSSLRIAADVLGRSVSDQRTAAALAKAGATGTYTVEVAPDSAGPLIKISIDAASAASADRTVDLVVAEVGKRLQSLQFAAGAPQSSWISAALIGRTTPAAGHKKVAEVVGLLLAVGLAMTAGLAVMAERRAHRRTARAAVPEGGRPAVPDRPRGDDAGSEDGRRADHRTAPPEPGRGSGVDTPTVAVPRPGGAADSRSTATKMGVGPSARRR